MYKKSTAAENWTWTWTQTLEFEAQFLRRPSFISYTGVSGGERGGGGGRGANIKVLKSHWHKSLASWHFVYVHFMPISFGLAQSQNNGA